MSARATATSPAEAQGKKKDGQHDAGSRITPRASILGLVILVAAIFAVAPARAYLDQRAEQQRLTQQVNQLEASNAALEQRLAQLHDPVELERLARECLGLVDPGEIAFVAIRHGQAPVPPSCD
jgi:cell division protein FtsB